MTQTTNPFFDQMAKFMTNAAGAAQGMRQDAETFSARRRKKC